MPLVADDVTSPDLFADACDQVRDGLMGVLGDLLIPSVSVPLERIPVLRNRQIVDRNEDAWAAQLRSPRHVVDGPDGPLERIHAILVGLAGTESYDSKTVGRKGFRLRFTIDNYYEDEIGTDDDNPASEQAREVARTSYALYRSRYIGCPGLVYRVVGFRERRSLVQLSLAIVRVSLGEIYAELQPIPMPVS